MRSVAEDVAAVGMIDAIPKILDVVCRVTGMGFAAVARVTEDRWVACAVHDRIDFGIVPGCDLDLSTTICNEIRGDHAPVIIDHVAEDPDYRDHHTPLMYGFQSYISVPISHKGAFFGTLCAIDPRPAKLKGTQVLEMFELFAELIGAQLDTQQRLATSEAALLDERQGAELREQFIAVLGHDLRNPLASIDAGARLMLKTPLSPEAAAILGLVQKSVGRMAGLIDNILDFARGRLGGGFDIERRTDADLAAALAQVVAELQSARPDREIRSDIRLVSPVACEARRVAQLLSNLVANALTHGAEGGVVTVTGRAEGGAFTLSVANPGTPIAAELRERLFQPFSRQSVRPNQQGLGLGLYIASEIARAHGGVLDVVSDTAETRFTFTMPLA